MPPSYLVIIIAMMAGWMVQLYFSYRQQMAFNDQVRTLRRSGRVSVGVAGKRYRGGRAFVAIAVDDAGVIRDALSLSGWTTLARGKPLPALFDRKVAHVTGDREIPGLTPQQRDAARQAISLLKSPREGVATDPIAT